MARMRRSVGWLPGLFVAVLAAACSQTVSGSAIVAPPPPPVDHYRGITLNSQERRYAETVDQLSELDPCALIDLSQLTSAYGSAYEFGPFVALHGCTAVVNTPNSSESNSGFASAEFFANDQADSMPTTTIDGVQVRTYQDEADSCGYYIPLTLPGNTAPWPSDYRDGLGDIRYVHVYATRFPTKADDCDVATQLGRNVLKIDSSGNWTKFTVGQNLEFPLNDRNPCELMGRLPAGYRESSNDTDLALGIGYCDIDITGPNLSDAGPDKLEVDFDFDETVPAAQAGDQQQIIQGHPVLISTTSSGACKISTQVGGVVDTRYPSEPPAGDADPSKTVPGLSYSVVSTTVPCATTAAFAPAIVSVFDNK